MAGGWGSGPWGSSPWGSGEDETPAFTDVNVAVVKIVALDMVQIIFSEPMKNNAVLQDAASYTVTAFNPGVGVPVTVREVRTGKGISALSVLLVISQPTVGAVYDVTVVGNIVSLNNVALTINTKRGKYRKTKNDSLFTTRPSMYDLRPQSVYRNVLTAIGLEDDLIGGSENEGEDIFR